MKILKYILISFVTIIVLIVLFVLASVVPIDDTPYRQRDAYPRMQHSLDSVAALPVPRAVRGMTVGWALENITPAEPTILAGSGPGKDRFIVVHDSIYVRTMVIGNGTQTVALVAADMLIIPPAVTRVLKEELLPAGFSLDNIYLSATHTHSSIGHWGENLAGEFYSGSYSDSLVRSVAGSIARSIAAAAADQQKASLKYAAIPAGKVLFNRLADEAGGIDSLLRVLEVERADSSRLILASYTGHPTCVRSDSRALSRDYPGVLVDSLENSGYDFAMFMAGAVGSHGCSGHGRHGWERVTYVGEYLASVLLSHPGSFRPVEDSTIAMFRAPLALGDPQVRITKRWGTRSWLFRTFFGEYPSSLTALRLGNVVMLGAPCDFSGELMPPIDSAAARRQLHAMVTSFNGSYIGYITLDRHYDIDHYETRVMNWYGPGNGAYLTESMLRMLEAVDR